MKHILAVFILSTVIVSSVSFAGPHQHNEESGEMKGGMMMDREQMAKMHKKMNKMHEIMRKVDNEKNYEKRSQLMKEHMDMMSKGMNMMTNGNKKGMSSMKMEERMSMMEKHMTMMQGMMQQMMNHNIQEKKKPSHLHKKR